jgi:hypothetical protein
MQNQFEAPADRVGFPSTHGRDETLLRQQPDSKLDGCGCLRRQNCARPTDTECGTASIDNGRALWPHCSY